MAKGLSSKRHAQAVFEIALEHNELDVWTIDLAKMEEVLQVELLTDFLENPKVPFSQKQEVLKKVLPDVRPLAFNFLCLLVAKNRLRMLSGIVRDYKDLVDLHEGRVHAQVTTAVTLGEKVERQLTVGLAQAIGKEVIVETEVDPGIVGGMVVRVGDRLIDGSVQTRLRSLREELIGAEIT